MIVLECKHHKQLLQLYQHDLVDIATLSLTKYNIQDLYLMFTVYLYIIKSS